ncbi:MAG: helix-turn-helix transcriptional regulator [Erythrobacter sp.]|nr:helix-turn-helix transcriptional regulator [Erythrobacter sp.]
MAASPSLDCPFAALNDRELEVLRLLAAGHTAKSIAARLGRSEASINERLRDARRKTGVGSSRELARQLAARKTWDKEIDLAGADPSADHATVPASAGRFRLKGTIIMVLVMALSAVGLALSQAGPADSDKSAQAAAPAAALPLEGSWSLDIARLPDDGQRPRSVVMDFRRSANRVWTTQCDIVAADGSTQHAEAVMAADGVPVPMRGNMPFADMVSLRQPAPGTLVLTFTQNGQPVSSRVYTVEDDRQQMTETIIWAHDTDQRTVTTYFTRAG